MSARATSAQISPGRVRRKTAAPIHTSAAVLELDRSVRRQRAGSPGIDRPALFPASFPGRSAIDI